LKVVSYIYCTYLNTMEISELKNRVLDHIDTADERLLKLMKALAESYENQEKSATSSLSEKQYEILEKRRKSHFAGESKSLTWEQTKKNARNGKK